MNANALFNHLDSALAARDAGAKGDGIVRSRLIGGIEFGQAQEEPLLQEGRRCRVECTYA